MRQFGVREPLTVPYLQGSGGKVTDRLWEMSDMVKVLEDWKASQAGDE